MDTGYGNADRHKVMTISHIGELYKKENQYQPSFSAKDYCVQNSDNNSDSAIT